MEEAINVLDDLQPRSMSAKIPVKIKRINWLNHNRHCLVRYNISKENAP
jgi:hypothetical protein